MFNRLQKTLVRTGLWVIFFLVLPQLVDATVITFDFTATVCNNCVGDPFNLVVPQPPQFLSNAPLLDNSITSGTHLTGSYTFDSSTAPSQSFTHTNVYSYNALPFGIQIHGGNYLFETDPSNVNFNIRVSEPFSVPPSFTSSGEIKTEGPGVVLRNNSFQSSLTVTNIFLDLTDFIGGTITSTALPTSPPDLSKLSTNLQIMGVETPILTFVNNGIETTQTLHCDMNTGLFSSTNIACRFFSINAHLDSLTVDPTEDGIGPVVPEPSTWLLLGSGLAGLAAWRRKKAA